jgi:hypothetical protein
VRPRLTHARSGEEAAPSKYSFAIHDPRLCETRARRDSPFAASHAADRPIRSDASAKIPGV